MALTPERSAGTTATPVDTPVGNLSPQATTVPSDFRARLKSYPAETATTFERPDGTLDSPLAFPPQATTEPSDFSARLCWPAAEIATTFDRPAGGVAWP